MRITISIEATAWELAELAYRILHARAEAEIVAPTQTATRYGNKSPTANYMLLPSPEQVLERRRKIESEASFEAECMKGVGCGGWS